MNDSFVTAINTQRVTKDWMDQIAVNMSNVYTPGFKSIEGTFKSFLTGSVYDELPVKLSQGKSMPGTSDENVFLEGKGYFVTKKPDGNILYTRLGEFKFDGEGVYKTKEGYTVQGYLLNDKGEIQAGVLDPNLGRETDDLAKVPTTDIKLWIDPSNGKYLGKYEEFEIKGDGILYGKADKGKIRVPLYKISLMNFHNAGALTRVQGEYYLENEQSGAPIVGRGEVRGGLIEMSNVDLKGDITDFQQAKVQLDMANKLISTNKQLLEEALKLLQ